LSLPEITSNFPVPYDEEIKAAIQNQTIRMPERVGRIKKAN
jgi:hypothetical protein